MMGQVPAQTAETATEVPSLLVPIGDQQLLLPTVSVAEMLPFQKPQLRNSSLATLPPWFLGNVRWRGVMVPMISYEVLNGGKMPAIKGVSQMAVLNNTGMSPALPFLCFPTQGIPRLSRVSPTTIKENAEQAMGQYDAMHVLINGEVATIPDVAKLESQLVDLLKL